MISQKLLMELKTIIKEDYGIELTDIEISALGHTLLSSFGILLDGDTPLSVKPDKKP